MTDMDGGELEIIKMEKYDGMKALTEGSLKKEVRQWFSFQDLDDENDVNAFSGHWKNQLWGSWQDDASAGARV